MLKSVNFPTDWTTVPFGRVAPRVQDSGRPDLESLSVFLGAGVVPRSSREDNHNQLGEDMGKYLVVKPGDIVFNKLRTWQGGLGASKYLGLVSPAYFVCRPKPNFDPTFLQYLLLSSTYLQELTRISKWQPPAQFDIGWEQLKLLPIVAPDLAEQKSIADYLDRETARIDALIEKKKRMIELLEFRAMTCIEARIEKLIEAASSKLKYCFKIVPGQSPSEASYNEDGSGLPLVNGPAEFQDEDWGMTTAERFTTDPRSITEAGDVLICLRGSTTGRLNRTSVRSAAGRGVAAVRGVASQSDFLFYVLLSQRRSLLAQSNGATFMSITTDQLGNLSIPSVSDKCAADVVSHLNHVVSRSHKMAGVLARQIHLLRKRRQALITAAVTGELEIPEEAA